jgi:hypothetical protein
MNRRPPAPCPSDRRSNRGRKRPASNGKPFPDGSKIAKIHWNPKTSALIGAGIDVVKVSRRLGHSSPVITLSTYAHLFGDDDGAGVEAIEQMMK